MIQYEEVPCPRAYSRQDLDLWWKELSRRERMDWKRYYESFRGSDEMVEAGSKALNIVLHLRCIRTLARKWAVKKEPYTRRHLRLPGGRILDTEDERVQNWLRKMSNEFGQ